MAGLAFVSDCIGDTDIVKACKQFLRTTAGQMNIMPYVPAANEVPPKS